MTARCSRTRRPRRYSEEQYLKSPAEMLELFADAPELLVNTLEVAKRCSLEIRLGASMLPAYPVPAGRTTEEFLRETSRDGLRARLAASHEAAAAAAAPAAAYEARLELELGVICSMGFAGYFLIVADFIRWAREHGVPVGPGRGSGAGSLVAYVLGITDLDPIEHDLLFERFLNPERVSMPDFDVDFCMEGRDRVIEYVANKYGRDRVSQIITYGTLAAKAVVRDVGRVLGHPYGFVDKIAKLIPMEIGMTLDKALEQEEELKRLYEAESEIRDLIDLARILEGLARNAGTNASGVVIAPVGAHRFHAAVLRRGQQHAGDAVRQGRCRSGGLGQIRFSRTAHAHHHRLGGARHQLAARRGRRAAAGHERAADGRCAAPMLCSRAREPRRYSSSNLAA